MDIIKLFSMRCLRPYQTFLDWWFCYFIKGRPLRSFFNSGGYSNKPTTKTGSLVSREKGRDESRMLKVIKCNRV